MKSFLAAALALPAALAASTGMQSVNANFDDITVAVPIASLQPIGVYKGLSWTGFNAINVALAPVGVAAESPPQVAVQYILSTGTSNAATLTPASSKTKYFSLQSFYFGCVASSQETVAGVPLACTLTLTGKKSGQVVVTQDISFTPGTSLTTSMQKVDFVGEWTKVDSVEFKQTGVLALATSVLYDNVQYTLYTS